MALTSRRCRRDDGVVDNSANASDVESRHQVVVTSPIVVGIDGSDEALRGLLFAADLAETFAVELVVVHAYGLIGSFGDWRQGVEEREKQVKAAMADEWCAPLADRAGLAWEWRCVQGNEVEGILRVADEIDAAFIVVGSHGAGDSSSPVLGSTSQDVVRHSHRPVIVIPPADDHRHRRGGVGAVSPAEPDD